MTRTKIVLSVLVILLLACNKKEEEKTVTEKETALFTRTENPVFQSSIGLAADPSALLVNDTIFLYYSAEEGIAVVYSLDNGATWRSPNGNNPTDYIALERQADHWDNTLETVEVIKLGSEYKMYYSGYRENESDNSHVENYEIGFALSLDGFNFERHSESINQPILQRDTSNELSLDRHAMTSPGVVYENGTYYMIYAAWNVSDNWTGANAGIRILGATSTDGLNWEKIATPILSGNDISYSPDINEASLMKSDDGFWYIPFSTDKSIGIARSTHFDHAYEVYPKAIITPKFSWDSEVTAPDGFIQNGKMRLWFHGVKEPAYWPWVIGYTEADYPLKWN